jgi:DNA-binding transcriptional MocR family regulator
LKQYPISSADANRRTAHVESEGPHANEFGGSVKLSGASAQNPGASVELSGKSAEALAGSVERAIMASALRPGERLPTVRALAGRLGLSPATVAAAFKLLRTRGLVAGDGRRGTVVCAKPPVAARGTLALPAGVRNLALGNPDPALLPDLTPMLGRLQSTRGLYGRAPNRPELIRAAARMFEADGIPAREIAVVGGAFDGIERVLTALLRPGDRVAIEDPGYPDVLDLARALGLLARPVRLDDRGLVPTDLARVLKAGVQALVVTPRAQNPTGAALDADRTGELRALLKLYPEVLLIEDDHAGPISGADAFTLLDETRMRWAIVRSVSKFLGPDLRLAMVAGDPLTIARVNGRQRLGTGWVSHILQQVAAELLGDAATQKLIRRAARKYAVRRAALIDELARHGIVAHGRSGLNVWIPVAEESASAQALMAAGWAVAAGERFRLESPPAVRVTIAALKREEAAGFATALSGALKPDQRGRPA